MIFEGCLDSNPAAGAAERATNLATHPATQPTIFNLATQTTAKPSIPILIPLTPDSFLSTKSPY